MREKNTYLEDIQMLDHPGHTANVVHNPFSKAGPEKVFFCFWPHSIKPKLVSREEFLWLAIQKYCEDNCHHLVYDLRGQHRIRITWGDHTSDTCLLEAKSFDAVLEITSNLIKRRIRFIQESKRPWTP